MSNYSRLIGKVNYVKSVTFGVDKTMTEFQFSYTYGEKGVNIPCKTWDETFRHLEDGDYIELVDYLPMMDKGEDKDGNKKSKMYLLVKEAVQKRTLFGSGFVGLFASNVAKRPENAKFDISNAFTKSVEAVMEEEDVKVAIPNENGQVSLEGLDEFKDDIDKKEEKNE